MRTKWQRQILAVIAALKSGATKCEQTTGTLYSAPYDRTEKPQACALGAIFVDGKNVMRIRSVSYDKVYKEHPVLRTEAKQDEWDSEAKQDEWDSGTELADHIITMNDSYGLSFAQIISWLRKLARRQTAPRREWPAYGAF